MRDDDGLDQHGSCGGVKKKKKKVELSIYPESDAHRTYWQTEDGMWKRKSKEPQTPHAGWGRIDSFKEILAQVCEELLDEIST